MSQPYIGEIRLFAGNFAPQNWMTCDGQLLSIVQNTALFSLLGTTYGGDGVQTFALPNLAGRVPVHMGTASGGTNYVLGQSGGAATVTLTTAQMPSHAHAVTASGAPATLGAPAGAFFANAVPATPYAPAGGSPRAAVMNAAMIASTGGGLAHDNLQPYATITYIISLFGVFPSQS